MTPVGHALLNAMYQLKEERDRERKRGSLGSSDYRKGLERANQIIIEQLENELERLEEMERRIKNEEVF